MASGLTLEGCLGGGANSAVFLATSEEGRRAIRLVRANPSTAEVQLSRWQKASRLSHPNLLRILGQGRCRLDDTAMLYVVMEFAEENLSQIIPERSLTAAETREMLTPALNALRYVHRQGFVHARIKPSNIMAIGDQVKLSGDGLWRVGEAAERRAAPGRYDPPEIITTGPSPAGDAWSLGMTLAEILTQKLPVWSGPGQQELVLPQGLDAVFAEVVRNCLKTDARRRWSVDQISMFLEDGRQPVLRPAEPLPEPGQSRPWRLMALVAAALLLLVVIYAWNRTASTGSVETAKVPAAAAVPQPAASAPAVPAATEPAPAPKPSRAPAKQSAKPPVETASKAGKTAPQVAPGNGDIMLQVMPKVTQHSLDAIHGRFVVVIRAKVDGQGNVTQAEYSSRGPSRFFAEHTLAAARQWHFRPADGGQDWLLRFEFSKGSVSASPTKSAR